MIKLRIVWHWRALRWCIGLWLLIAFGMQSLDAPFWLMLFIGLFYGPYSNAVFNLYHFEMDPWEPTPRS